MVVTAFVASIFALAVAIKSALYTKQQAQDIRSNKLKRFARIVLLTSVQESRSQTQTQTQTRRESVGMCSPPATVTDGRQGSLSQVGNTTLRAKTGFKY